MENQTKSALPVESDPLPDLLNHYEDLLDLTPKISLVSTNEARRDFSDIVNKVAYGNESRVITRQGKELAAVISIDHLKFYRKLADYFSGVVAKKRLEKGGKRYTHEEVLQELGLQ